MAGENKNAPRGFAGLDDMVSDVNVPAPPVPTPSALGSRVANDPSPTLVRNATAAVDISQRTAGVCSFEIDESRLTPPKPKGLHAGWKWAFGIGGVFLLIGIYDSGSNSNKNSEYSNSSNSTTATAYQAPPVQIYEERPPVGTGVVFSDNQIRYCVAEDIRMSGWSSSINSYSQSSVDSFNNVVADFNARCSSYKYKRGALERVKSEVETRRYQLNNDGIGLALRHP